MADDRIVKFCPRVGPRSVCLVMTNCPPDGRGQGHVTSSFLQINVNISKTVQDRYTYKGRLIGNSILPMKCSNGSDLGSFTGCRPFEMQSPEPMFGILHDFN